MSRQTRVLHVIGTLRPGGVETWLRNLARRGAGGEWTFDFCLLGAEVGLYGPEVERLGCRIFRCGGASPMRSARRVYELLREHPYQVVHSHVHHFSGPILAAAWAAGVPVRIAHSHNTRDGRRGGPARSLYRRVAGELLRRTMTLGVGCSEDAADHLFGSRARVKGRARVLYCGIDLEAFTRASRNNARLRREIGLNPGDIAAGFVGRLDRQKNPFFLLEIARAAVRLEPRLRFVVVGEGPLDRALRNRVEELGLNRTVTFAGPRIDVASLMVGVFDVLLLPSLHEGLPLSVLEAQAAGIPSLISNRVTGEAAAVPSLVRRLSLEAGAEAWGAELIRSAQQPKLAPEAARAPIDAGGFSLEASHNNLTALYAQLVHETRSQGSRWAPLARAHAGRAEF